jgi:serine/threonine protein kinase
VKDVLFHIREICECVCVCVCVWVCVCVCVCVCIQVFTQAGRAFDGMHEKLNLIHCDIACRNLLIHRSSNDRLDDAQSKPSPFECFVSDFGLSRTIQSKHKKKRVHIPVGLSVPVFASAPEVLRTESFTKASDVWYVERQMHSYRSSIRHIYDIVCFLFWV